MLMYSDDQHARRLKEASQHSLYVAELMQVTSAVCKYTHHQCVVHGAVGLQACLDHGLRNCRTTQQQQRQLWFLRKRYENHPSLKHLFAAPTECCDLARDRVQNLEACVNDLVWIGVCCDLVAGPLNVWGWVQKGLGLVHCALHIAVALLLGTVEGGKVLAVNGLDQAQALVNLQQGQTAPGAHAVSGSGELGL